MSEFATIPTNAKEQAQENQEMDCLNQCIQQNIINRLKVCEDNPAARRKAAQRDQRIMQTTARTIASLALTIILVSAGAVAEWIGWGALAIGFGRIFYQILTV